MYLGNSVSTSEARVALGYRLEQLLRFCGALQTSRLYPLLDMTDIRTPSMSQFVNFERFLV